MRENPNKAMHIIKNLICSGLILSVVGLASCAPVWMFSWTTPISPIHQALQDLLESSSQEVVVAVYVTSIGTAFSPLLYTQAGIDINQWKLIERSELLALAETELQRTVGKYKNFKVIDRTTRDKVWLN